MCAELPWGGYRESGVGKDRGFIGLKDFTQVKMVCIEKNPLN
jgi:acyl-CoA reductase-like NAD-dependent aldehyde dehydrogenase